MPLLRRNFSIQEYQSQALLRDAGIPVPVGTLASTSQDASRISNLLGGPCVLKSQILAGGRRQGYLTSGLQGGIHVVQSPFEAGRRASEMLGYNLVTKQTEKDGLPVERLYVTEKVDYIKEFYLSITIDRKNYCPAIITSKAGGTSIEDTAKTDPQAITCVSLDYKTGITEHVVDQIANDLGAADHQIRTDLGDLLRKLYSLFIDRDATLLEINPLVVTDNGRLLCLDAKFNFDSAAKQRQAQLFQLGEKRACDPAEIEAEQSGLVYVRLDGNIGNIVNGAGLAMATNDAISYFGGASANFLDAGGQATKETMVNAFRIILKDERVKVILVNIYGGIIKCDMIAESIIAAATELGPLKTPLVVRLQGTNSEQGQKLVAESGISHIHAVDGFGEATQLAVQLAKG